MAKKENAELYVTNHKGDILYPKNFNKKNVKSLILNNINYANAIPTSKEEKNYIVYIYKNNHQSSVKMLSILKHINYFKVLRHMTIINTTITIKTTKLDSTKILIKTQFQVNHLVKMI